MSEVMKKEDAKELARFRPATDILEREDGFHIYMDLPGVKKEDMAIDLEEDELTITGRAVRNPNPGEKFVEMQFGDCEYVRSISISDIVDRERIKASLENGVLELYLPKVEKVQPKRITISAE
ncbi:MAG: Hsp20/alpha crystallin family protein [Pseudodesulfovibrio sp.]|jgi:HSP20 family molecular chaperone IbpA|uniref:HSP20 family molecular chaperone IbpA n=1 Tax=Pseudodesulfovibrio indicus TaxID=1716143 RepID=A0A126QKH8_9BACT|nr:Hsp20/alpha crystallin family protein [Pseudodesulfovibrio indicus]AMK10269.1 molecular chaperone Hsp20 [Pseudodesulfovibrio indicus]TDT87981.1 HSP20 family molecular chaperone IbpA [Pseudodesulfovibrio indicus]